MKSIWKSLYFKVLVLALAVTAGSATTAHAQAATGKFTLAHKARWGSTLLPPGDYTFSLESGNWPARITIREASGSTAAMILPLMILEDQHTSSSSLVLTQESGESFVSKLRLGNLGLTLDFASPKLATPMAETAKLGPMAESQPAK